MPKYSWACRTEPEAHLGGRRITCPRGKVLGGSSSINGLVYVRGNPLDFDGWEALGAAGWGYRHVLPYFRRAEGRQEGGNEWRGGIGPLATRYGPMPKPLYAAFVKAAKQAGYKATSDINGADQEGFGRMDMTVKDGVRWSAANAYLRPAMKRPNLDVRTHARATRITFEGRRAIGVRYLAGDAEHEVRARGEVILAGGPINSPQLLRYSCRASGRRGNSPGTALGPCSTSPASARTCRTTPSSTSSSPASSRSPSTPTPGWPACLYRGALARPEGRARRLQPL